MSEFLEKFSTASRYFLGSRYEQVLIQAKERYVHGDEQRAMKTLERLPGREKLMQELMRTLKGKPVEKTLRKIADRKVTSRAGRLKGLFSFGTHVCIEMENGNPEYQMLLEDTFLKLQTIMLEQ